MRERFGALGIGPGTQVVVYDADSGMYAARLWWMLRFMGHDAVAVLDGGFARWVREGHAVRGGRETWRPATFAGAPREDWRLDVDDGDRAARRPTAACWSTRAPKRAFAATASRSTRVAGHIPGARNLLLPAQPDRGQDVQERRRAARAIGRALSETRARDHAVMYCGSGVTACHNLLALEHAGLQRRPHLPRLLERMVRDPDRPLRQG